LPGQAVVQVSSLEVRWILAGALPASIANWFARFSVRMESRQDIYLVTPRLAGLSVKIRGDATLDVKSPDGSPEVVTVAEQATGRMNSWQKWAFPLGPHSEHLTDPPGWTRVRKSRNISQFSSTGRPLSARRPGPAILAACTVEVTDIRIGDAAWWTLGFEARGPAPRHRATIDSAAAALFDQPLPEDLQLGIDDSFSYAAWVRDHP
jgi:hypothetical protein